MNHVTIKGTLPRAPRIMEPKGEDKQPIALFTVACRNGDLGGLTFIERERIVASAATCKGARVIPSRA